MKRKIGIVVPLVLITIGIVCLAATRNKFFDSKVYYGAIRYWFQDGGMVYDWLRPGTPYGFTYPPFAGLVMSPMAVLPFPLVIVIASIATVLTTGLLMWWFAGPLIKRKGWTPWSPLAVAVCLAVSFEPVRETITFGQVNTLLLTLVAGDLLLGLARGRNWAGVGIGLATPVKLTPGVFILYLLLTRRWRAAATAAVTFAIASAVALAVDPRTSVQYWTTTLWETDRVGRLDKTANQSILGVLARLDLPPAPGRRLWLVLPAAVLAVALWRAVRAYRRGDELTGITLA